MGGWAGSGSTTPLARSASLEVKRLTGWLEFPVAPTTVASSKPATTSFANIGGYGKHKAVIRIRSRIVWLDQEVRQIEMQLVSLVDTLVGGMEYAHSPL